MIHRFQTKTFLAITVFCLLLSFVFVTQAQQYNYIPFPDSNAVWSEVYWKPVSEPCPRWVYNKYALFNEDTIINGIKYHKLYHTNNTEITVENSVCIGGIREDSLKRVYVNSSIFQVVPEIKEVLLYDFSLNEGDTLFNEYSSEICTNCFGIFEVVSNIDTIKINNKYKKVITFNNPNKVTWIEGIGNLQGLLQCWPDWPTNGMGNDLVCMHQNDTLLYYYSGNQFVHYDNCVPSFVIDDITLFANPDVKVYPNPVKGESVCFENLDFETLELFDIKGNLINKDNILGLTIFELKTSCLPPGIYSYQLKTRGLVPTMGKLVIL